MTPVIAHVARISHGEGKSRAIEPGTMKTPTPMVVPMTIQIESNRLNRRGSSDVCGGDVAGAFKSVLISPRRRVCQHPVAFPYDSFWAVWNGGAASEGARSRRVLERRFPRALQVEKSAHSASVRREHGSVHRSCHQYLPLDSVRATSHRESNAAARRQLAHGFCAASLCTPRPISDP